MKVDFAKAERAGFKALKHARYLPHQPNEDSVILTLNRHFMRVAYLNALTDHARGWKRKGFRPGHAPVSLVPEPKRQEIAGWVCEQAALYALGSIKDRLDPPPMIPVERRNLMVPEWRPGQALRFKARFQVHPHVPDPMQMFNLEIPLEDDPIELAYAMMGSEAVGKRKNNGASPPAYTSPSAGGGRFEQRHDPAKADVAAPANGVAVPAP